MAALRRQAPPELEDAAPLLNGAFEASSWRSCAGWYQVSQARLLEWWQITTCESFLTSPGSRRDLWSILSWSAMLISLAGDCAIGAGWTAYTLDGFACVVAPFLGFLPRRTLRSDAIVVSAFMLLVLGSAVVVAAGLPPFTACFYGLILAVDGVHSTNIAVFFVGCAGGLACVGVKGTEVLLVVGPLCIALAVVLEYRAAICVDAVRKNHAATRDLLDKAGDGFCSMDAATGLISSASPKLERTLGARQGLAGRRFRDFVVEADVRCVLALCAAAQTGELLQEDLVTCRVPGSDQPEEPQVLLLFEAKLLPHMVDDGELCICVQVQGEMRLQPTAGLDAEPAPAVRALPPPPDPDNQSQLSFLTYSTSHHGGQGDWCHRPLRARAVPAHHGAPVHHSVDAATQTLNRPPLGVRVAALPRPAATGSASAAARGSSAAGSSRSQHRQTSASPRRAGLSPKFRLLPQCPVTPPDTVKGVIIEALRGINAQGRGCCGWHVLWKSVLRDAFSQTCQPGFTPYTDFQCARCLAMNQRTDPEDECCGYCGEEHAVLVGPGAATSSGEAADVEVPSRASSTALPVTAALDGAVSSSGEAAEVEVPCRAGSAALSGIFAPDGTASSEEVDAEVPGRMGSVALSGTGALDGAARSAVSSGGEAIEAEVPS